VGAAFDRTAADIAHAFDGVASTVIGYADMLMQRHADRNDADHFELTEIQEAGRRAAVLARQLRALTVAIEPEFADIDLNRIIAAVHQSLRGLLRHSVAFSWSTHDGPVLARVDGSQMEDAIASLVLKAQDLVARGHVHLGLSIGAAVTPQRAPTACVRIAATALEGEPPAPAPIALDPRLESRGLHLSAAYAVIRRNGGTLAVDCRSEAVVFTVSLPARPPVVEDLPFALVVDDEDAVRQLAGRILRAEGFRVVEAASVPEALEAFERRGGDVNLVLSDLTVGDDSGIDLIRLLAAERPELKAVMVTGEGARARAELASSEFVRVVDKPFTVALIVDAARAALTAPASESVE
jgi:two-component system cell cycle sensor histidine kinase/response regulator CckA